MRELDSDMLKSSFWTAKDTARGVALLCMVGLGSSVHAQSAEKEQAYIVYDIERTISEATQSSSPAIEKFSAFILEADEVLNDETIFEPILNEWFATSEVEKQNDSPEWLHGLDVVHPGETRELPWVEVEDELVGEYGYSHLWIAGWDGLILHSRDDGLHWEKQASGTDSHLQAVDFVDTNHGMIVGENGTVLTTRNGGKTWSDRSRQESGSHKAVDCLDQNRCWFVGAYPLVYRTTNGGRDWRVSRVMGAVESRAILMLTDQVGVLAGLGAIWRTKDGGRNWNVAHHLAPATSSPVPSVIYGLSSADGKNIWAVGRAGDRLEILKSEDMGQSWVSQTDNIWPKEHIDPEKIDNREHHRATAVFAPSSDHAFVAATNGYLFATTDGGQNWWVLLAAGSSDYSLHAISFRNERTGWVAGNLGQVWGTISAGEYWVPMRGLSTSFYSFVGERLDIAPDLRQELMPDLAEADARLAARLHANGCQGWSAPGCTNLGYLQQKGLGVAQDYEKAAQLYEQGCDGGHARGCTNLGYLYVEGLGVAQDYQKAVQLYEQGCDGGNARGCTNLGYLYRKGLGVAQDYERAERFYEQGCDGGDALGCTNLGYLYEDGLGVVQDYQRAAQLYEQGCDGGNARGCTSLGYLYRKGLGVVQDYTKAIQLYERGCDGEHAKACSVLGFLYSEGEEVEQNLDTAIQYAQRACDADHPSGCNNLAWAQYQAHRYEEALVAVGKSLRLRPDHATAIDTRAHILAALGKTEEALVAFEKAADLGGAELVSSYQEALLRFGYDIGEVDGIYGERVRAALYECLKAGCRLLE